MDDDDFNALKGIAPPPASAEARRRALGASLMAFDQAEREKNTSIPTQGVSGRQRLMSIVSSLKGNWIMDTRRLVPAGTAALALLILLPLGYQLYSTTSLTQPINFDSVPPTKPTPVSRPDATPPVLPATHQHVVANTNTVAPLANPTPTTTASPSRDDGLAGPAPADAEPVAPAQSANIAPATPPLAVAGKDVLSGDAPAVLASVVPSKQPPMMVKPSAPSVTDQVAVVAPAVDASVASQAGAGTAPGREAPIGALRGSAPAAAAPVAMAEAAIAEPAPVSAPAVAMSKTYAASVAAPTGGLAPIAQPNGDTFAAFTESPQKVVATDPVSTFSIDVDTASYSYMRRALNEGRIPEPDAVRLEEMINYFPYDYPAATSADVPFKPTISVFPTPWNSHTELMQIGIKGFDPPASTRKPANLVFLIDTSGSMDEPDKLPLLQHALTLLVNTMSPSDTVSIVAYAGSAGVVLEPTKASQKAKILTALDNLEAGGSTAGAEGIELAYNLASQHKVDGNNRVILATDGDFNVGISDPDQLKQFIKQKRQSGIGLSVLGFGEGNLDDATMQALAQNGDGNASYIDSLSEAQKVLVKEAGSTLDTIAKDVKIQVEFNPATVASYRLIGYETRALNREDFNNDKVDAGDVGAGHTVTALYEITPVGADATPPVDPLRYGAATATSTPMSSVVPEQGTSTELADFKLRYKLPGSDTSRLIEEPVTPAMAVDNIANASSDARWAAAVAAFGQKLKGSDYAGALSYGDIVRLAQSARGSDPEGYRSEFINLVGLAGALTGGVVDTQPVPEPAPPIVN